MPELDEFAEALFGQLDVELNEEKEIRRLDENIAGDPEFNVEFNELESVCEDVLPEMTEKAEKFLGIERNAAVRIEYPELDDLKRIKGQKVFCSQDSQEFVKELFGAVAAEDKSRVVKLIKTDPAKYLVYSTYAIQYTSKITTTYGDYMNGTIFVNRFVLSRYPRIILYKMGKPYSTNHQRVASGYRGAIKMTILEEVIHSMQDQLYRANRQAAMEVNTINERLAGIILDLGEDTVKILSEYLQLQAVPDDFPFARRANLFFFLNPDHFLTGQVGPDVMTYTHIEIDPKISGYIPELLQVYKEWLPPIQRHHAAFSTMEGMAGYAVRGILGGDPEFEEYLSTFMGTDSTSYHVRKGMGMDFTAYVREKIGRDAFATMTRMPPTTLELKDPARYLRRATAS